MTLARIGRSALPGLTQASLHGGCIKSARHGGDITTGAIAWWPEKLASPAASIPILYNPITDLLETENLASRNPEVVAKLGAQWLSWWESKSGTSDYSPKSTAGEGSYNSQGDRATGDAYVPSAMPERLSKKYPAP